MSCIGATGLARLVNADDIENAGLELYVGFRGSQPVLFDYYTQSGGEKTTSIMAFLLAIQQLIRSPFRAVDEFDIHMDPRNREAIYKNDEGCRMLTDNSRSAYSERSGCAHNSGAEGVWQIGDKGSEVR